MKTGFVVVLAVCGSLAQGQADTEEAVDQFDWRETEHGNLVSAVRNYKGMPGKNCFNVGWIYAATAMVSDRLAILQPTEPKVQLSTQVLINCARQGENVDNCVGTPGKIGDALRFIMDNEGIPDRTCMGYRGVQEQCAYNNMCFNCLPEGCTPRPQYFKYSISSYSRINVKHIKRIVRERGPVACEFNDKTYGTVVGFRGAILNVKKDEGTFYRRDGFTSYRASKIVECWEATVELPTRYFDRKVEKENEKKEKEKKKGDTPENGLFGVKKRFEGLKMNFSELVFAEPAFSRELSIDQLPKSYTWEHRNLLTPVQSHHNGPGYCGACWSMASASTYSDRLKIHGKGKYSLDVYVSPQTSVDCVRGGSDGCNGGGSQDVDEHIQSVGTVDETCNSWVSGKQTCQRNGTFCKTCSEDGTCKPVPDGQYKVYRAEAWGNLRGEVPMMKEIYKNGPIDCLIATPEALGEFVFGDDIICDRKTDPKKWSTSHVISVVGYGENEDGAKYWVIRNSWSTAWGNNGFAKVCRGENQPGGNMLLESACSWVLPTIN